MTKEKIQAYISTKLGMNVPLIMGMDRLVQCIVDNYTEFCDETKVDGVIANADVESKKAQLLKAQAKVAELSALPELQEFINLK